jgi:ABC-type uncharacterized transport system ATPase component
MKYKKTILQCNHNNKGIFFFELQQILLSHTTSTQEAYDGGKRTIPLNRGTTMSQVQGNKKQQSEQTKTEITQ